MALILLLLLVGSLVMGALTKNRNWLIPAGVFSMMFASKLADAPWWLYGVIIVIGLLMYMGAARRYHNRSGRGPTVIAIILAILAFFGLLISSVLATPSQAAATSTPDQATINALTVTTVPANASCTTDANGLVPWNIGTLKPVGDGGRKWSDSVELPFTSSDPAQVLAEVLKTNCENPEFGIMNANAFANLELGDVKVLDLNPWLQPFAGNGDTVINAKAASYVTLLDVKNPSEAQVAEAAKKNKEYQEVAAKVNTLILKFVLGGVHSDRSIKNYHLLAGGLTVGTLPAIGLNDHQEGLSALQLYLTDKGQAKCFAKIGYNLGDRRWEQFTCSTPPAKPTPPGSTPTPGTSTHPGTPPGTTPPGGCKTGCTPTTPTTTPPTTNPPHECVPPKPYGTWPNCYGPKSPAPQPSGVEKPTNNPVGPPQNTPPPPKSTPLQPGGGGNGGGTQTTAPANNNPGNPVTGAPTGAGPTSCVPPPGKTTC